MDYQVKEKFGVHSLAVLILTLSVLTMGAANLSQIFTLMQEIIDNTDVIVGIVIMGVTISIAIGIGAWIKKMLNSAVK